MLRAFLRFCSKFIKLWRIKRGIPKWSSKKKIRPPRPPSTVWGMGGRGMYLNRETRGIRVEPGIPRYMFLYWLFKVKIYWQKLLLGIMGFEGKLKIFLLFLLFWIVRVPDSPPNHHSPWLGHMGWGDWGWNQDPWFKPRNLANNISGLWVNIYEFIFV